MRPIFLPIKKIKKKIKTYIKAKNTHTRKGFEVEIQQKIDHYVIGCKKGRRFSTTSNAIEHPTVGNSKLWFCTPMQTRTLDMRPRPIWLDKSCIMHQLSPAGQPAPLYHTILLILQPHAWTKISYYISGALKFEPPNTFCQINFEMDPLTTRLKWFGESARLWARVGGGVFEQVPRRAAPIVIESTLDTSINGDGDSFERSSTRQGALYVYNETH